MATQQQIAALYQQYLGREPDPEGLAFYSNPDFSLALIEQDIANSAEARGRAPLDVQGLLGSLTNNEAAGLSTARDINAAFPVIRDGTVYNFLPDGTIEVIKPSDTTLQGKSLGATLAQYSPTGEVQVAPYFNPDYGQEGISDLIGKAVIATIIGGALGLPGVGLSAPASAAAASGATTLGGGGSVENAAKSALLSALIAGGIEAAFPNAAKTAADTAVNLAQSGASESAIRSALIDAGVNSGTASMIAADAVSGATAAQIASEYAGIALGGSTAGTGAATGAGATTGPVVVTGSGLSGLAGTSGAAATGAMGGLLGAGTTPGQSVQVQGQNIASQPGQTTSTTGGVTGGLLGTTQAPETVNVQAQRQARINDLYQTILGRAPDAAGLAFYSNPQFTDAQIEADIRNSAEAQQRQQVAVTGQNIAGSTGSTAGGLVGSGAGTAAGASVNAPQNVEVVDRSFQSQTFAPVIPVTPTQTVNVDGRGVQTASANIGAVAGGAGGLGGAGGMGGTGGTATGGQGGTASASNQLNLSLLDAAAITALMGGLNSLLSPRDEAPVVDQAALNTIINAPRPAYSQTLTGGVGQQFTPGASFGGLYQIAPTNVYNPFAAAAPFGAGRFGATAQPITLPGGLLGAR